MSSRADAQRAQVLGFVQDELKRGETVVAVLPFAATPKRPKGPEGKIRTGVYQSQRRYRPLVLTTQRLFVLEAVRTPYPRRVLADYPISDVELVDLVPGRFTHVLSLDLPDVGTVPFRLGRYDVEDLPQLRAALER
jgi:hypothetical protein